MCLNLNMNSIKCQKIYDFISSVNKEAYKDIYLLSNQVLSKNPFTNNFLKSYLKNDNFIKPKAKFIFLKLLKYYFLSFKDFISYLAEYIEFLLSFSNFRFPSYEKELILIDTFFIVNEIKKNGGYTDAYFPGLSDSLKKKDMNYAYLPVFEGLKRRFTMLEIFKILKRNNIPILSEYQLLSINDFFWIFYFIFFYPFRVLKFLGTLDQNTYEMNLLKSEIVGTLDQVTFRSFSRYLQGKNIANLPYKTIKVISWYENQVIHKNLYKGLRANTLKVKIYGSQFFIYLKNFLNLFPDENEIDFGILPDKILVNGPAFIPKKTKLNYAIGPSFRYSKLFNGPLRRDNRKNILVLLPYFKDYSYLILHMLSEAKITTRPIFIKSHRNLNMAEFKHFLPQNATLVNSEDTYKLFESTKILIGSVSGVLVEAASLGIPVISITNDELFDYNPLPDYGRGKLWEEVDNPQDLKQKIDLFEYLLEFKTEEIDLISNKYKQYFFCEPTEEIISNSFDF